MAIKHQSSTNHACESSNHTDDTCYPRCSIEQDWQVSAINCDNMYRTSHEQQKSLNGIDLSSIQATNHRIINSQYQTQSSLAILTIVPTKSISKTSIKSSIKSSTITTNKSFQPFMSQNSNYNTLPAFELLTTKYAILIAIVSILSNLPTTSAMNTTINTDTTSDTSSETSDDNKSGVSFKILLVVIFSFIILILGCTLLICVYCRWSKSHSEVEKEMKENSPQQKANDNENEKPIIPITPITQNLPPPPNIQANHTKSTSMSIHHHLSMDTGRRATNGTSEAGYRDKLHNQPSNRNIDIPPPPSNPREPMLENISSLSVDDDEEMMGTPSEFNHIIALAKNVKCNNI